MKTIKNFQRIAFVALLIVFASSAAHAQFGGLMKKAKAAASKVGVSASTT